MWQRVKLFLFENRNLRQTVLKNTFWLGVSNVGGRLLRAVIIIYAARILGVAEYGVFSYAVTLAAFLTIFIDFGLNHLLVREFAKAGGDQDRVRVISTLFFLKAVLVLGGVAIILWIAPAFTRIQEAKAILPVVALILAFDSLREFAFSIFRAKERMEWEAGLFLFTNLAIVVLGFAFLAQSPTIESFTKAYALGVGIGTLTTFAVLRKDLGGIFSNFSKDLIKPILVAAWPFAISGLLGGLMLNTDILIIGWFRTAEDVGLYSAAQRIIQVLYVLPAIVATSALPTFARFAWKEPERFRRTLEKAVGGIFALALPFAAGGIILAPQVIGLVFGQEYLPATGSFMLLLATLLVDFPAVILANAIFAHDRQRILVIYAAIGGLSNVVLDFLLIPRFGIEGSAFGTLLCQLASNIYLWRQMKKISGFQILPRLRKIFLGTAALGGVAAGAALLGMPVLAAILLAGLAYGAALYALKEPMMEEMIASVFKGKQTVLPER